MHFRRKWLQVKPTVRFSESDEGCIIFDDTIEKSWMDENELICWHYYDHSFSRNVKGINLLNCLYHVGEMSIPVAEN